MELTDLLPLEKWAELENDIHQRFAIDANVFNADGRRITTVKNWVNRICPAIKDTDKGQAFICAVAHMNIAIQARNARKAMVEECDAGIVKIVVPVFVGDEFVGAFGACGKILDDGEVDSFMVNRTTGIEEAAIEALSSDIGAMSEAQAEEIAAYIKEKVDEIVGAAKM